MFQNIVFSPMGVRRSVWILVLYGVLKFARIRPGFVVPTQRRSETKSLIRWTLEGLLVVFAVLLPLQIGWLQGRSVEVAKNLDIQVLFDVSLSMTADDIQPNRFDAAKSSLIAMAQELTGYNMSIIFFSGKAFVGIPFTTDTQAVQGNLSHVSLNDFPPTLDFVGTAIGDALVLWVDNLEQQAIQKDNKLGIIVLMTDGDSNIGIDPTQALPLVQKAHVPVYTIAVGQDNFVVGQDKMGQDVLGKINLPLLQNIAKETGGTYYRVLTASDMKVVFQDIRNLVRSQETKVVRDHYGSVNTYLFRLLGIILTIMGTIKVIALARERTFG